MKVGTDGVLLGAWAGLPPAGSAAPLRVLDIGTGTGLVALMLAQRLEEKGQGGADVHIDAIDIDRPSAQQAADNFAASPWAGSLQAHNISLQDFCAACTHAYSLIVSNPPFYQHSLLCPDVRRTAARHTCTLSYAELLHGTAQLLAGSGKAAFVLPADVQTSFLALAAGEGLAPVRLVQVRGNSGKPAKRLLAEFVKAEQAPLVKIEKDIVLADMDGARTPEYSALTSAFYL